MTLTDVRNLGILLKFVSRNERTNVDEENGRYSGYKEENGICIRIANHRTKLRTWLNNFKGKKFPKKCISIVFLHKDKINQQPDCKLPSNVDFVVDEFVYNMDNINFHSNFKQLKGDILNVFKTGSYANNPLQSNDDRPIRAERYKVKKKEENCNEGLRLLQDDKLILEELVRKYGKRYVTNELIKD